MQKLPISVLIPTRNEAANLPRCLQAIKWADEIVVVDSDSSDRTPEIARESGATVLQYAYRGGWPRKRQWTLDTFPFRNEWILMLDADEIVTPALRDEIGRAITDRQHDGYYLRFQIVFLGRQLRFGDTEIWKLFLFRRGMGRFEFRTAKQDQSMGDTEVHEHVVVDGLVGKLRSPVRHENVNSLDRYIAKHNEYSNWEVRVQCAGSEEGLPARWWGTQAQRRRWIKGRFIRTPGFPLAVFVYKYFVRLGFLDGMAGFIYCGFQAIQFFHVQAKIVEAEQGAALTALSAIRATQSPAKADKSSEADTLSLPTARGDESASSVLHERTGRTSSSQITGDLPPSAFGRSS
jgi:glycosyltransferase involved in cell wall biosynthesis